MVSARRSTVEIVDSAIELMPEGVGDNPESVGVGKAAKKNQSRRCSTKEEEEILSFRSSSKMAGATTAKRQFDLSPELMEQMKLRESWKTKQNATASRSDMARDIEMDDQQYSLAGLVSPEVLKAVRARRQHSTRISVNDIAEQIQEQPEIDEKEYRSEEDEEGESSCSDESDDDDDDTVSISTSEYSDTSSDSDSDSCSSVPSIDSDYDDINEEEEEEDGDICTKPKKELAANKGKRVSNRRGSVQTKPSLQKVVSERKKRQGVSRSKIKHNDKHQDEQKRKGRSRRASSIRQLHQRDSNNMGDGSNRNLSPGQAIKTTTPKPRRRTARRTKSADYDDPNSPNPRFKRSQTSTTAGGNRGVNPHPRRRSSIQQLGGGRNRRSSSHSNVLHQAQLLQAVDRKEQMKEEEALVEQEQHDSLNGNQLELLQEQGEGSKNHDSDGDGDDDLNNSDTKANKKEKKKKKGVVSKAKGAFKTKKSKKKKIHSALDESFVMDSSMCDYSTTNNNNSGDAADGNPPERLNLLIEIVSAQNILIGDTTTSDPYVVVELGDRRIHKTSKIMKTLNPQWDRETQSTFLLACDKQELLDVGGLTLKVKDWDRIGGNDPLGHVQVDGQQLLCEEVSLTGDFQTFDIIPPPTHDAAVDAGTLTIRCRRATKLDYQSLKHKDNRKLF